MSLTAATIDAMLASGCTAEQFATIVKADIVEREAALSVKRGKDRDRQRECRARHAMSHDVTVTDCDERDTPALSPSPLSSPHTPQQTPRPHTHPDNTTRARKAQRLPVDWEPKALPAELAKAVTVWPPGALERELARFRDWAASASGQVALKNDWDAAWRNWIRKAIDEGRNKANGNGSQANRSMPPDNRDGAMRALDRRLGLE